MTDVKTWTGWHVRVLRDALRMKQQDLADSLHCAQRTVSYWEGRPERVISITHQRELDRLLASADDEAKWRFAESIGDGDVDRRQLIAGVGAAAGLSVLPGSGNAPAVTPEAIAHLRNTVHSAMMLDDQLGSSAARPIMTAQASTCAALLRDCPTRLRPQLQRLTAEATASSAWAASDQGEFDRADRLFMQAYRHAEDSGDMDVVAGILGHRVQLAITTHRYGMAAGLADASLGIPVQDGRVRDYRYVEAAQALAHADRHKESWALLDKISGDHPDASTPDDSYAYYQSTWLTATTTADILATAGEQAAAVNAATGALACVPVYMVREQALTSLRLTRLVAPMDLDRACAAARSALDLARMNTSPRIRHVYKDTRAGLQPWVSSRAVQELDEYAANTLA